mmetsp:Transcript_69334/g.160628  ORF Transcript_69334/g.160628 Transcript_69334/m.160628 type:complete len:85 (-) Transcript_69334:35-289(-)
MYGRLRGSSTIRGQISANVTLSSARDGRMQMKEVPGSERLLEADLVLLALGFLGPEQPLAEQRGERRGARALLADGADSRQGRR